MTMPVHILGDGILGLMMAAAFLRRGQSVVVHGPMQKQGASWHAGGMLAPAAESDCGSPLVMSLGQLSLPLWRQWQSDLHLGDAIAFHGSLMVAHSRDMPLLEDFQRQCQRARMPVEVLSRAQLSVLEPALADRFNGALWLALEGAVAPEVVLPALRAYLQQRDVRFERHERLPDLPQCIRCLGMHEKAYSAQVRDSRDSRDSHRGRDVHDPRGLRDLRGLRGLRGEALKVHAPDVKMQRPIRVMHPRYPLYVVPRPQQRFYIGATQLESEDLSPISVRASLELLSAAASLDPGFLEARVEKSHVALRPTLSHGEPRVIKTGTGLAVNGLYRHGILLAPIVAEQVAAWWLDGTPTQLFQQDEDNP